MCENDRQRSIYSTSEFLFCILVFNIFDEWSVTYFFIIKESLI